MDAQSSLFAIIEIKIKSTIPPPQKKMIVERSLKTKIVTAVVLTLICPQRYGKL